MKIGQMIKDRRSSLSFEFFPPKDIQAENQLFREITKLEALKPTFVSVTYGAGGSTLKNTRQIVVRILQETTLVPMPHLTCVDQGKNELKSILLDYSKLGVENILALRGDPPQGEDKFTPPKDGYCYAKDLVQLAASLSTFSIGVAVYPEGHCESPNLELDTQYTKQKIDAGADFAITQMFFDNRYFYDSLKRFIKAGIKIPVIPGIMPITDLNKIKKFSQKCGATVPDDIVKRFEKAKDEYAEQIGIEIAVEQCQDLIAHGVRYLHFYTLNRSDIVLQIVKNLNLPTWEGKPAGTYPNSSHRDDTEIGRGGIELITEEQIKELAHTIWEQEGRPHGQDVAHYFRAKQILEERESSPVIGLASPTPKIALKPPLSIALGTPTQIQGYCVKCRTERVMKDAQAITMKNGKPATRGVCPVCGTKMFRIGKR